MKGVNTAPVDLATTVEGVKEPRFPAFFISAYSMIVVEVCLLSDVEAISCFSRVEDCAISNRAKVDCKILLCLDMHNRVDSLGNPARSEEIYLSWTTRPIQQYQLISVHRCAGNLSRNSRKEGNRALEPVPRPP